MYTTTSTFCPTTPASSRRWKISCGKPDATSECRTGTLPSNTITGGEHTSGATLVTLVVFHKMVRRFASIVVLLVASASPLQLDPPPASPEILSIALSTRDSPLLEWSCDPPIMTTFGVVSAPPSTTPCTMPSVVAWPASRSPPVTPSSLSTTPPSRTTGTAGRGAPTQISAPPAPSISSPVLVALSEKAGTLTTVFAPTCSA